MSEETSFLMLLPSFAFSSKAQLLWNVSQLSTEQSESGVTICRTASPLSNAENAMNFPQ
jgi:hypothetical protein